MDTSLNSGAGSPSTSPSLPPYMGRNYPSFTVTLRPASLLPGAEFSSGRAGEALQTHTAQPSDSNPPLFDIEKEGDPRIKRIMYYDFMVTKTEAYLQLQPGYLPTNKYPCRIPSEPTIIDGEKRHVCCVPTCTAKPFTRHYDLERHFLTTHQVDKKEYGEKKCMNCDYKRCSHSEPFRKDHCREHYREFHYEDLLPRRQPMVVKSKHGQKKPEAIDEFLAARIGNLDLSWWRCSKCLWRVYLKPDKPDAYTCPGCNMPCEPERVVYRENARKSIADKTPSMGSALALDSAPMDRASDCGLCKNTLWVPCPRCQPGVKESFRMG